MIVEVDKNGSKIFRWEFFLLSNLKKFSKAFFVSLINEKLQEIIKEADKFILKMSLY